MLSVALVGADGSGKSTVTRAVLERLDRPTRLVYLGANPAAHTHALPTTRLVQWWRARRGTAQAGGPPAPDRHLDLAHRGPVVTRPLASARAAGRVTNQIAEEAYQRAVSGWHLALGRVVIFDRHHRADHHAHDLVRRPGQRWSRRLHGTWLRRCFPDPDLLIVLDAPVEVLWARKQEGSVEALRARREEYLSYAATVADAAIVDASQPLDQVVEQVLDLIDRAVLRALEPGDLPAPGAVR